MTTNRIVTQGLNVWIGRQHILRGVDMEIPQKGITCIVGPSGCGKTTLLKSFSRLIELEDNVRVEGRILVDGEDILPPSVDVNAVRKKMGLLSQKPYPLPLSIYGNVAYGVRLHYQLGKKALDERVAHYLAEVGLWEEVKHRLRDAATGLSIGQQQRLCLARGLAVEPEVILCDEPTSALDPIASKKVEELLVKLSERYTIILVTHFLRQARKIADYINFVYFGELVEGGPAARVLETPQQKLTREYLFGDLGY